VTIVDDHEQRLVPGGVGQQAEEPGADGETVTRRRRPQRQRPLDRSRLGLG
jgi:hypothetical protein